ncbi:ATP-dependent endonuclease [Bdellovibrio sp. KM01]|uniref:ATP-dependent nuclease n=1 Tax=Bdellovibrio sp. KM01 TaxID=2748865 RepID=UPI0015EA2EEB|nr:AAA family ATPase [Bdellovibrio sp. KM01]QLY26435.1 AAA family ATPase [Bdellovibrio sp. KM01]
MHLSEVEICNFRLFSHLKLILNQGINIFVGENDAGKTAFVDAIRLTLGTSTSDRYFIQPSDFNEESSEFSIKLKFEDLDRFGHILLEHLTYESAVGEMNTAVLYVTLTATLTGAEKRGVPIVKTELRSGADGGGPQIDAEIRSFLATTYLKPLRDAESELSSGRGSRLSQILGSSNALKDQSKADLILKTIADANSTLVKDGSPISDTSIIIRDKYLHKLIFETDKSSLQAIIDIAGVKNIEGLSEGEKRRYLKTVLESLRLSLSHVHRTHGLGYHNILFMAAELLLLEQELESESPLLLIEEPEAHLHPQLQLKLLNFLVEKAKSKENQTGLQVILTTHSPTLTSNANPHNLIVMSKGVGYSLRASETLLDVDDYSFIQKFLEATKANLFFSRGVLLVEGDSENILLPTLARLLNAPLENYGVTVVNVGNTSWKRYAKIFLRKNSSEVMPIKVAVMRDLDLWPDCAELVIENKYGFKIRKDNNAFYWASNANDDERRSELKCGLEMQNVKIFISDKWTFEFCLAYYGLFEECVNSIHGFKSNGDETLKIPVVDHCTIEGDLENKATYVLREIESSKTDFAVQMAKILEEKYRDKPTELKSLLPPYIVNAISFATGVEV